MARVRLLTPQDLAAGDRELAEGHNLSRAMAHSPEAVRRFYALLSSLWDGSLGDRYREVAILSVVAASDAPYPLGWHLIDAKDAGLTDPEIAAIVNGDAGDVLAPADAAVAGFARELTLEARVSDPTFEAVAAIMTDQQIVELALVAGLYRMVSCVANGLDVDLDEQPARALREMRT